MKIDELTPKETIIYASAGLFLMSWLVLIFSRVIKEIKKFLK